MGKGTYLSSEQTFLKATALGPKFRAFHPESWDFSLLAFTEPILCALDWESVMGKRWSSLSRSVRLAEERDKNSQAGPGEPWRAPGASFTFIFPY